MNNGNISSYILKKYNISIAPGRKGECPFCGNDSFSIKSDDGLGKCFHPCCNKTITKFTESEDIENQFQSLLYQYVFLPLNSKLLEGVKSNASECSKYLQSRKIKKNVVEIFMLGEVPENFDPEPYFIRLKATIQHSIEHLAKEKPKKPIADKIEELTRILISIQDINQEMFNKYQGWLAFFYTNEHHQITSVRFRKPFSKKTRMHKWGEKIGVFGTAFVTPNNECKLLLTDRLLVLEGEFNFLSLQSLFEQSFQHACAVGGVNNADYITIKNIERNPVACYDNDPSGAGFQLVKNATNFLTLEAFTTPDEDSDLDSFIGTCSSPEDAIEKIKKLSKKRTLHTRNFDSIKKEIFNSRNEKEKPHSINTAVANIIFSDMEDRGVCYHNGMNASYFLSKDTCDLIPIYSDELFAQFLSRYGLQKNEDVFTYVQNFCHTKIKESAREVKIFFFSYFNKKESCLYLFNQGANIYKITSDKIEEVPNGTDDILFLKNPNSTKFKLLKKDWKNSFIDELLMQPLNAGGKILSNGENKLLLLLAILSMFFPEINPTKMILAIIGPKGAIKTSILRNIGKTLEGHKFEVTALPKDPDGFDAVVSNKHFVVFDNVDKGPPWLNDKLAIASTGGINEKRKLYSDNEVSRSQNAAFIGVTSRTPDFTRDDVADRILPFHVERKKDFMPLEEINQEIAEHRNQIMTEIILSLPKIIQAFKSNDSKNKTYKFRMADFASFGSRIFGHFGLENEFINLLTQLEKSQSDFTLVNEPIFDLLCIWAETNSYHWVENKQLCRDLSDLSLKHRIIFPYEKNERGFSQKITQIRSNLENYFVITSKTAGGHKVLYNYRLKEGHI